VDVTTDIEIDRPRLDVAAYASDPDRAPEWYENIERVEWKTPKPLTVGSRIAFVARFLGRTLEYTYEISELLAGEKLVMSTAEGPFPMETTYTWRETPSGGTHMTLRNRGRPTGFSKLMSPLTSSAARRANRKDLANLKRILEGQGPAAA
jgi:Polyketide cyclase / dehydrase and lipid transport